MARITIEPTNAKAVLSREDSLEKLLKSLEREVGGVQRGLRRKISGQEQISARLNDVRDQLAWEAGATRSLRDGLDQIVAWYEKTENGNRDKLAAKKSNVQNGGSGGTGAPQTPSLNWPQLELPGWAWLIASLTPFPSNLVPLGLANLGSVLKWIAQDDDALDSTLYSWKSPDKLRKEEVKFISDVEVDLKTALKDKGVMKKISDWESAHKKETPGGKYIYDSATGKVRKVDENDAEAMKEFSEHNKGTIPVDVRLAGIGTSNSVKKWGNDGETSNAFGGLSGEWGVFERETHADAYVSALGIGAAAGASFCVFSAEGKAYLGDEDTQVYVKGGVDIGRAGAEAKAGIGLVDKNGKINPNAHVSASAELIGGELSGSVGAKIAGTDVALKGSVNYGVGAHLDVGVHDGKISMDVGASLGVGVGVKLEVDVSGTVKAIGEGAKNAVSFIKSLF